MLDPFLYEVLREGLKVLFLLSVPLFVGVTLSSLLVTALQTATAIQEPSLGYAVRVCVFVAIVAFFLPSCIEAMQSLCRVVYGP